MPRDVSSDASSEVRFVDQHTVAYLHGIATALPTHRLDQHEVRTRAQAIFADRYPHFDRIAPSFDTAGIAHRHSVVPLDWLERDHKWSDRNAAYLDGAKTLFIDAATRALDDAGWSAGEVDCVVTVSSTGIATPSLDAMCLAALGFRQNILRMPIFGLGCAGGVCGLTTAQSLAVARPQSKVLLVVVEACSTAFRADRGEKADIIAAILFGDGAAAVALSTAATSGRKVALGPGSQKTWVDTLDVMGWSVDHTGLGVIFDRSIPDFVQTNLAQAVDEALSAADVPRGAIDRFLCHPGGAKVVTAIEEALALDAGTLDAERNVLREAGNMSAPTVLFVLDRVLRDGFQGQLMSCALGPGFTAAFLPIHVTGVAA